MRRFSQRSALVTLSEINITPLLDLAFVLLIIFVITTPLLEQGINLNLPKGGAPDRPRDRRDIRTVEISPKGTFYYNKQPMSLPQIEANLVKDAQANPNLVVDIRADEMGPWKNVAAVMDCCQRHGIKIAARTEPPGHK
jgi:biopolymer transport protein ExbD/biopolymer transport protein TolR